MFLDLEFGESNAVMADKGFRIEDLLTKKNIELSLPPFQKDRKFTHRELELKETREIASLRLHMER